ncbi:MAG: helix-turn-helix domain-containing protein [Prevotella sp.]|jgi:transcriptional regulator with XRE-family HTH domain|nr:helix-turn-helix domain-containing protein [Prevotella sp.]
MEEIIDRINKLIRDNKISELELSNKIGIGQRSINYYTNKRQKPSLEFTQKIIELFNIDANWLVTGKGEMLKTSDGITGFVKLNGSIREISSIDDLKMILDEIESRESK